MKIINMTSNTSISGVTLMKGLVRAAVFVDIVTSSNSEISNHVYRDEMRSRIDVPEKYRIEKTVFIKAPRSIAYGEVAKVIDGLKGAGAEPVGLQLDGLN